jgi:hypothetical protein
VRTRIALAAAISAVTITGIITGIAIIGHAPHDVAAAQPTGHRLGNGQPATGTPIGRTQRSGTHHRSVTRRAPVQQPDWPPPPPPPPPPTDATSTDTTDWQCIRVEESGDRYNDPSAPSGAYGILGSTWASYGYAGWPYQADPSTQDALALLLYSQYGWAPWSSRYACGL